MPVLSAALYERFSSRGNGEFAAKVLSALRFEFGGHQEKPAEDGPEARVSAPSRAAVVFLVDVDNTLLDNDRVTADLRRHLDEAVGPEGRARYWALFEQLRAELGYADYLGALQRYRLEFPRRPASADRVRLPGGLPVREPALSRLPRRARALPAAGGRP